jgi:tetratricopeptide (TPR) repeat protein
VINALNTIQWCPCYPAILDVEELDLGPAEKERFNASLTAYRSGDLLQALANFPSVLAPETDAARTYQAALLLAVGQVKEAHDLLERLAVKSPLADPLRKLVAVVQNRSAVEARQPRLATEWLAESHLQQSLSRLDAALTAARASVEKDPSVGFGWG